MSQPELSETCWCTHHVSCFTIGQRQKSNRTVWDLGSYTQLHHDKKLLIALVFTQSGKYLCRKPWECACKYESITQCNLSQSPVLVLECLAGLRFFYAAGSSSGQGPGRGWHCLSSRLPMWHHEAADYCSHVDYTIEKPGLQVKIARMQVHIGKFLAINWGPQNVVAVLTSSHAWQPIALQLRGDCSIRRFKQIQLIWMMRCCYPFMTGWTLVRENCTSTTKCTWTALQTWAAISGAICHYLGCVSARSISHCITFCFTMKTQEMMTAHYGSWCWRILGGSAHIVGHDSFHNKQTHINYLVI